MDFKLLHLLRHAINLHLDLVPQNGLHRGARGQHGHVFEEFRVGGVEAVEVFDVREMHGASRGHRRLRPLQRHLQGILQRRGRAARAHHRAIRVVESDQGGD